MCTPTPMFITALFTIDKIWMQPKWPSISEWIKKMWYTLYNGILLHLKKKKDEILPFATTWMDLKGNMLRVINQVEENKYGMIALLCGILNKRKQKSQTPKNGGQKRGFQRLGSGKDRVGLVQTFNYKVKMSEDLM